jgi:hypothetical protein
MNETELAAKRKAIGEILRNEVAMDSLDLPTDQLVAEMRRTAAEVREIVKLGKMPERWAKLHEITRMLVPPIFFARLTDALSLDGTKHFLITRISGYADALKFRRVPTTVIDIRSGPKGAA